MRSAAVILVIFILVWASASFIKPAFCHAAEIRDVVPGAVDGAIHLSITVWHNVESSLHYVDIIEVTWGDNVTSLTIAPASLAPDGTFTVDYNMGPVSGTPTITVRARCTLTGYSGAVSWTGTITEPGSPASPSPSPSPVLTPTPTPTPSPTPIISPSPSPIGTPSPSPTASPTPQQQTAEPTQSPAPQQPEPFPIALVVAASVIIAVACLSLFVYFKKRKMR